jgi:hypothetical protein
MKAAYPAVNEHDVIWITQIGDAIGIPGEGDLPCCGRLAPAGVESHWPDDRLTIV